jgi:diaminopimelate epimerase
MGTIPFTKMHGLGNDFVVIDARRHGLSLTPGQARAIARRHTGVGCDQIVVIERPAGTRAQAFMRIRNADGGEVGACGNAARCVAALLMAEASRDAVRIETAGGLLEAARLDDGRVTVDMGRPRTGWEEIPLAGPQDTLRLDLSLEGLSGPVATGMGNPHATFFVADAEAVDLARLGPVLEHDPLFPERCNIGVAQIVGEDAIRLRVWERGAGITLACGTGACAAAVAAHRRGLTGRRATLHLDGGVLEIDWRADGHVMMTGPAAVSFTGEIDTGLLDAAALDEGAAA